MGASTAGVLSSKSISYSQDLVLVKMLRAYFSFINYTNLYHRSYGFSKATPFGVWGWSGKGPKCLFLVVALRTLSRIRLANWMSLGMMVTRLVWIAHRLASSNSLTRYASTASWRHSIATDWNRRSVLKSWVISLTNLWKGSLRIRSAVFFWK